MTQKKYLEEYNYLRSYAYDCINCKYMNLGEALMKKYIWENKVKLFIAIITNIGAGAASVLTAFLFEYIIQAAANKDFNELKFMTIFSVVYVVLYFALDYLSRLTLASYSRSVMISIKEKLFDGVMNKDIRTFVSKTTGDYLALFQNDMNILEEDYFKAIVYVVRDIFSFVIAFISIFSINFKLSLGITAISSILLLLSMIFSKSLSLHRTESADAVGKLMSKLKDLLSGYEVIKSFNIEFKAKNEFSKYNKIAEDKKYTFFVRSSAVGILTWNLGLLIFLIVMLIGGYFVAKGIILISALVAMVQLLNNILNPIGSISDKINKFNSTKGISERISSYIKEIYETKSEVKALDFKNKLTIDNLSFSYDNKKLVLKDIDLVIEKGKKYAIIGESGCGKSTLLKLILNYYNDYGGSIIIDETNYREINPNSIYDIFSVIHQNVFIFDGTVKENIMLYQNYTDEQVENVIKLADLSKFINNLPNGLDTEIGENGSNLSGGERQRISIARALIKNTPILILDEATSALDKETAQEIEKEILSIEGITCIVVTHKLTDDNLTYYNKIFKIEDGSIKEIITAD